MARIDVALAWSGEGLVPEDEDKLRRAIALSRETYCSVLHTLRADLEVRTEAVVG